MKIEFDKYGCCTSGACLFRKSCAQHETAGDFRTEDGFRPEIIKGECLTTTQKPVFSCGEMYPTNEHSLDQGFIPKTELFETENPKEVDTWAEVFKQIEYQAKKQQYSDMDILVVWKLGVDAFQTAKKWGAKFPHESD